MPRTREIKDKIFKIVEERQPVTLREVCAIMKERYDIHISEEEMRAHLERLRSDFPKQITHSGSDRFSVVNLSSN